MIQTETSKAKIIFVSVPNAFSNFDLIDCHPKFNHKLLISNDKIDYDEWGENSNPKLVLNLPQGNWTILNVLDDVTEDEAMGVLGVESLHSLATSLGVEGKTIIIYELK